MTYDLCLMLNSLLMTYDLRLTTFTSKLTTIIAKIVSYVLHPLFIPTYVFMYLVHQFPY